MQEPACGSSAGPEPSRVGSSAELCAEQGQSVHSAWGSYWHGGEWVIPVAIAVCWAQASAGLDFPLLWVFSGSLPPSARSLATHPFLPQCVEEPEDLVACYLRSLCRNPLICRPILLDFSLNRKPSKILQPGKQALLAFVIFSVGRKGGAVSPGWGRRACPQSKIFGGFPWNCEFCSVELRCYKNTEIII